MQQPMAEEKQDAEQEDAQAQHKQRPMLKYHTDFAEVAFAIPPRDEDLNSYRKAHCQRGEDEVIQTCHHGGTQFVGAEVTQESGVSKGDDGLRKVAQHDGVSDAPDFPIGDCRFYHGAKILFFDKTLDLVHTFCIHFDEIDTAWHRCKANLIQAMFPVPFLHKLPHTVVNFITT